MRSPGIRWVVLLVAVFAFAVPVFASTPMAASGYAEVTWWGWDSSGKRVAEVKWTGTFEGMVTHTISQGRADRGTFVGCVPEVDRCGTLDLLVVRTMGDQSVQGFEGNWVILNGSGGLETLRGQGTFVISNSDPVGGPYQGQIHFDPE